MARKFGLELEFLDTERGGKSGISKKKLVDICKKVIPPYNKKPISTNSESKTAWNIKYGATYCK